MGLHPKAMLAVFSTIQLITYLDRGIMATYLGYIQDDYNLSSLGAGTLAGAYMVGYMLASPAFAHFASRMSPLLLMGVGLTAWCISVIGTGLSLEYGTILLARTGTGVGEAAFACMAPPLIDAKAPVAQKSLWMSVFYIFIPVGYAMGYLVAGQWHSSGTVSGSFAWRIPFIAIGIGLAPFVFFVFVNSTDKSLTYAKKALNGRPPETASESDLVGEESKDEGGLSEALLEHKGSDPGPTVLEHVAGDDPEDSTKIAFLDTDDPHNTSTSIEHERFLDKLKLVVNNRVYVLIILGYAAQTFVVGGFAYWGIRYVENGLHLSESVATLSFGGLTVATGVFGTATGGWLLDWLRSRAVTPEMSEDIRVMVGAERATMMITFCAALSLPCCVLGIGLNSTAMFFLCVGLGQSLIFMCLTPINSCVVWITPYRVSPLALALSVLANHLLGDAVSPIIIGALLDRTNKDWRAVFVIACLWLVWPIFLWLPAWRFSRLSLANAEAISKERLC
ncbi:hypothetical protein AAMO2058_000547700 [Amorphochlora amoebiformis]